MTVSNLKELYYIFTKSSSDFNKFYELVSDNRELRGCADYQHLFQFLHEVSEEKFVLAVYNHGLRGAVEKYYFNEL